MKFTLNSKPLKNVTDLGIIKQNISSLYYRSNIAQVTATRNSFKINVEAAGIKTAMTLKGGSGDTDETASILVDCSTLKSLIDSIDSNVITFNFDTGSLGIVSGTSKFTLPQILDVRDVQVSEPTENFTADETITLKAESWKFIKDHQLYAISESKTHPVYRNVWVNADKDVIVGDYETSLFTYSKQSNLDNTCLLPVSLVNLFTNIPEGSTISRIGKTYILNIDTDSYSMSTEFTPFYEEDEAVGSYNADIILGMLTKSDNFLTVDVNPITKFIGQISLLSQGTFDRNVDLSISNNVLTLSALDCEYKLNVTSAIDYSVQFDMDKFKDVLSHFDDDNVKIAPMERDGQTIGCIFWTDSLITLLASK